MTKLSEEIPLLSMKTVKERERLQITAKVKNLCSSNDPRKNKKDYAEKHDGHNAFRDPGYLPSFLVGKHHELNARMGVPCIRLVALDVGGVSRREKLVAEDNAIYRIV